MFIGAFALWAIRLVKLTSGLFFVCSQFELVFLLVTMILQTKLVMQQTYSRVKTLNLF
jgi:hypothetical protein